MSLLGEHLIFPKKRSAHVLSQAWLQVSYELDGTGERGKATPIYSVPLGKAIRFCFCKETLQVQTESLTCISCLKLVQGLGVPNCSFHRHPFSQSPLSADAFPQHAFSPAPTGQVRLTAHGIPPPRLLQVIHTTSTLPQMPFLAQSFLPLFFSPQLDWEWGRRWRSPGPRVMMLGVQRHKAPTGRTATLGGVWGGHVVEDQTQGSFMGLGCTQCSSLSASAALCVVTVFSANSFH